LANLEATTFVDALGSDPCKNHLTVRCMLENKVACSLCLYVLAPLLSPGPPVSFQLARAPLSMSGRPRIGCVSRAYYRTMLLKVRFRIIGMLKVGALTFVGSLLNGPGRPNSSLPYSLDRPVWRLSRIQIRRAPRPPATKIVPQDSRNGHHRRVMAPRLLPLPCSYLNGTLLEQHHLINPLKTLRYWEERLSL
jgi:hypothetical protein